MSNYVDLKAHWFVFFRAKVSAEAIAEIINSFVEPISYKTLVIRLALLCECHFY